MPSKPSCIDRQLKRPFQIAKVLIIIENLKGDSFTEEVPSKTRLPALVPMPQLFGMIRLRVSGPNLVIPCFWSDSIVESDSPSFWLEVILSKCSITSIDQLLLLNAMISQACQFL